MPSPSLFWLDLLSSLNPSPFSGISNDLLPFLGSHFDPLHPPQNNIFLHNCACFSVYFITHVVTLYHINVICQLLSISTISSFFLHRLSFLLSLPLCVAVDPPIEPTFFTSWSSGIWSSYPCCPLLANPSLLKILLVILVSSNDWHLYLWAYVRVASPVGLQDSAARAIPLLHPLTYFAHSTMHLLQPTHHSINCQCTLAFHLPLLELPL